MSFFDYPFPSNDVISCGKPESDPFGYEQQALGIVDLETVDSSLYDLLGMSEKSFNLEVMRHVSTKLENQALTVDCPLKQDMLIQSNLEAVPPDCLTQHMNNYGKQQTVKRETYTPELDEEHFLPSTINEAADYSLMESSPYAMEASSPAGRSTTSSTSTSRLGKSKGGKSVDKDSEEYRRRRMLNNIAVKKSREKAKAESRQIAQRVTVLNADKERLERRVEALSNEVKILHGLFGKMGNIPDSVRAEVARSIARLQSQPR